MRSRASRSFWRLLDSLPHQVQKQARDSFLLFSRDPHHNSLQFKQVHPTRPIMSARVSDDYRVLGTRDGDSILWFWIGKHSKYDRILKGL